MRYTLLFALLSLVWACGNRTNSSGSMSDAESAPLPNSYASGFKIYEVHNGYRISIGHPNDHSLPFQSFFVYTSGAEPKVKNVDFILKSPLKRTATLATTHIGFLDAINELDAVKGVTDPFRVFNPKIKENIESGLIINLGESMVPDKEQIMALQPDAVFASGFPNAHETDKVLLHADIPIVYTVAWTEKTPLARAEWIKFFGILFNKKALADSLFNAVEKNYNSLKALAAEKTGKPTVFCGNSFKGVWYIPGGGSYISNFIADAGGNYIFAGDTTTGSMAVSFEVVFKKVQDAEFWLNVQEKTFTELLARDKRYASFKPVQLKNVYNRLGKGHKDGGNDYYETATWRPDVVLNDLIHVFHDTSGDSALVYYKRLNE